MATTEIFLKPQELLFKEGDQSGSLYLLRKGAIRIFKRKGDTSIEIVTIRPGQLIGELAFLDHQARSASAEAIMDSELIEIGKGTFDDAISKTPEWFILLVRTISTRLRVATNKIRMLEVATTEYETDRHGNRSREFVYINTAELLRYCTALLAVASRYGKNESANGIEIAPAMLERYAVQVLQISPSKVVSLNELFKTIGILKDNLVVTDIRFLDKFLLYTNDQNLIESTKKRFLSEKAFQALTLVVKHHREAVDNGEGVFTLNIAPILKASATPLSILEELQEFDVVQSTNVASADEVLLQYNFESLLFDFRAFGVSNALENLNKQKRSRAGAVT